jgi:hypothetical protein
MARVQGGRATCHAGVHRNIAMKSMVRTSYLHADPRPRAEDGSGISIALHTVLPAAFS